MEFWLATLLFFLNIVDDILAVLFVRRTAAGNAVQAALISGLLTVLIAFSVVNYVQNNLYLIPIVGGSMVGCYVAVRLDKLYRRKKNKKKKAAGSLKIVEYEREEKNADIRL